MKKKEKSLPEADMNYVATTGQSLTGTILKINGKPVTKEELSQLQGEASQFRQGLLYKVLMETLKWEAKQIIFYKAKDFQDVLNGKMILHTIETQENIMKLLE